MTYSHFWFRHPALDIKALTLLATGFQEMVRSDEFEPWRPHLATYGDWLAIDYPVGPDTAEAGRILEAISAVTESDALYYHGFSESETMTYCHWKAGKLQRNLRYNDIGDERCWPLYWQVVGGEPEPWEREVFFTEKRLRAVLSEDHGASPEEKLAFEPYWQTGRIAKGQSEPFHGGVRKLFWEIVKRNELPTCYHAQ